MPFGVRELLAASQGAERVLDVGCGSGRLTVAFAQRGAAVAGIDTSSERLEQARERALVALVEPRLLIADFNAELPFADAEFDVVVSRLALMAAADPVRTLSELRRVLEDGGRLATVLWARTDENPWFAEPRKAVVARLGEDRAAFARAFGKLGDPEEAAEAHRSAGLTRVDASRIPGQIVVTSGREHWTQMTERIGHFSRLDASLSALERDGIVDELSARLENYRLGDRLVLPRTLVLVTTRR